MMRRTARWGGVLAICGALAFGGAAHADDQPDERSAPADVSVHVVIDGSRCGPVMRVPDGVAEHVRDRSKGKARPFTGGLPPAAVAGQCKAERLPEVVVERSRGRGGALVTYSLFV
ncbi:hypothetical protein QMO46_03950 [Microbacterium barkeri]|uniref:hypothetical protein n=1 Tax=Microbacterium barkeri TaxID=33917 RepID=UPI0024AFAD81|nr:hypothetical protein [Microbacterium barkeri]MDI6942642.1 hypothetical protein [Microbacterium barkeri]